MITCLIGDKTIAFGLLMTHYDFPQKSFISIQGTVAKNTTVPISVLFFETKKCRNFSKNFIQNNTLFAPILLIHFFITFYIFYTIFIFLKKFLCSTVLLFIEFFKINLEIG